MLVHVHVCARALSLMMNTFLKAPWPGWNTFWHLISSPLHKRWCFWFQAFIFSPLLDREPLEGSRCARHSAYFVESVEINGTGVLKFRVLRSLPPRLLECTWDLRNTLMLSSLHHELLWLHPNVRERGRQKRGVQTTASGERELQLTYKSSVMSKNQFKCKLPMAWVGFLLHREAGKTSWGHFTIGHEGCFIHSGLKSKLLTKSHIRYG